MSLILHYAMDMQNIIRIGVVEVSKDRDEYPELPIYEKIQLLYSRPITITRESNGNSYIPKTKPIAIPKIIKN